MTESTPSRADLLNQEEAAQRASDADAAIRLGRRAVAAAPEQPGPAFQLCLLLLDRQDPEANAVLGGLDRFLGYGPGWEMLGHALTPRHAAGARVAFERAAKAYAAMEAVLPGAEIAYRLGVTLRSLGDWAASRAALERATVRDTAMAPAWFALGLLRQDDRDRPGAVDAFKAAFAARPDHHEAAFNLAVALQDTSDIEGALDRYAMAWRLRPDSIGRVAQALISPASGRLWLDPAALRRELAARA